MAGQAFEAGREPVAKGLSECTGDGVAQAADVVAPGIWAPTKAVQQALQGELGCLLVLESRPVVEAGARLQVSAASGLGGSLLPPVVLTNVQDAATLAPPERGAGPGSYRPGDGLGVCYAVGIALLGQETLAPGRELLVVGVP